MMNSQELRELLMTLKACGATHFKSCDFEVTLASTPGIPAPSYTIHTDATQTVPQPTVATPVMNPDATDKLKGLIETLKMDDSQLIDKIFPAGAGG